MAIIIFHYIVPILNDMLKIIAQYPSLFTAIDTTRITKNQSILQQGGRKVDFMVFHSPSLENPQHPAPYLANGCSISGKATG